MKLAPGQGAGGSAPRALKGLHNPETKTDPVAQEVIERWHKIDDDLIVDRRNYWLNHSFYRGQQWLWWDTNTRSPRVAAERMFANERMRTTSNQIKPRIELILGRLAERNLAFEVKAKAADDATLAGADLAGHVLESRRLQDDWEAVRESNIMNRLFAGTSFISIDWDPRQGRLWHDPTNGNVIGEGEVALRPWSIASAGLEPGTITAKDARYWVGCLSNPPEQVQAHYDLPERPKPDGNQMYSPLQHRLTADRAGGKTTELTSVYVMYERPNPLCEAGRVVHVVNGQVVEQSEWPFPFEHLNLYVFRWAALSDSYRGDTPLNDARPLQVQYNHVRSNLLEHIKLAGNARLWVANGSLDEDVDLTDEPGEIVQYEPHPLHPGVPEYSMPAPLPRVFGQELSDIKAEMDDILYSHDVSRGIGADRMSGLAVAGLEENNNTPLGPPSRREAHVWGLIGSDVLKLYEANAKEMRKAIIIDSRGIPRVLDWNGARLYGQTDVIVPQESLLPQSHAVAQQRWAELAGQFPQLFANMDAAAVGRLLDITDQSLLTEIADSNANLAQFENSRMAVDEVMIPQEWHKHAVHIAEHNEFRNGPQWYLLPDQTKQLFDMHLQGHQQYAQQEALQQAQLNAVQPGLAGLPQAHDPIGSAIPPPSKMMQSGGPLGQQGQAA